MTRTFVAIELGEAARAHLRGEIERLRRDIPAARWVNPDGLHLTLAFLGELDDARLAEVAPAAVEATTGVAPFALRIGALGTFGPPNAPSVIWAGVSGALRPLGALHQRLAVALTRRGFALDARPYSPHLTLARIRAALPPEQLGRLAELVDHAARRPGQTPEIPVSSISVMKSELARPSARYTRLATVPLAPGEPRNKQQGPPHAQQAPPNDTKGAPDEPGD